MWLRITSKWNENLTKNVIVLESIEIVSSDTEVRVTKRSFGHLKKHQCLLPLGCQRVTNCSGLTDVLRTTENRKIRVPWSVYVHFKLISLKFDTYSREGNSSTFTNGSDSPFMSEALIPLALLTCTVSDWSESSCDTCS